MKKIFIFFLLTLWAITTLAQNDVTDSIISRTMLYRPGDYGSANYRIPAVITAKDGSLVAVTDKRKYNESDLPEDIDIVCNRSTDGGLTWSEPVTIAQGLDCGIQHLQIRYALICQEVTITG